MKSNAVAYTADQQRGPRKRGRPRVYGSKIKLSSPVASLQRLPTSPNPGLRREQGDHPVSGPRPAEASRRYRLVRFVAVIHPTRGACLLMCTDTSLDAIDIIPVSTACASRSSTPSSRQCARSVPSPLPFLDVQHEARCAATAAISISIIPRSEHRNDVKRKLHAYHVFIQAGIICQGLLQYLAVAHPRLVWNSFGSWLRTIRPGIPPSELVVAITLRHTLPEFLLNTPKSSIFTKFVTERQDTNKMQAFRLAA